MLAIIKKELKSYFFSPIGYIAIGILLAVFGMFFYLIPWVNGITDLGWMYYNTAVYGTIVVVPLLTMRMFSEERKNGTEQLLFTSPTTIVEIVLGKVLAALILISIALIFSLMFLIILSFFGEVNIFSVLTCILGFLLFELATISLGMFLSSITENQIISAVLTLGFLIITLFFTNIGGVFNSLSLINYYESFSRGVISLSEVTGLLSFSLMFILFTVIKMKRKKIVK